MVQVSLQNLAQPQIVSTNTMIPQQMNTSNGIGLSSMFLVISLLLFFIGLPLILYLIYNRVNSKASDEANKLK